MILNVEGKTHKTSGVGWRSCAGQPDNIDLDRAVFEIGSLHDSESLTASPISFHDGTIVVQQMHGASPAIGRNIRCDLPQIQAFFGGGLYLESVQRIESHARMRAGILVGLHLCHGIAASRKTRRQED